MKRVSIENLAAVKAMSKGEMKATDGGAIVRNLFRRLRFRLVCRRISKPPFFICRLVPVLGTV